jgi:hypothetical protein
MSSEIWFISLVAEAIRVSESLRAWAPFAASRSLAALKSDSSADVRGM